MNRPERLNRILQILETERSSSVQDLSRLLGVSHMTIRRDLVPLVEDEQIRILHGSVVLHPKNEQRNRDSYYSLIAAGSKFPERKRAIGALAASLIEPDDALIIDSGSTTEYLAKCLPEEPSYTVLCYALNILSETVRRRNCRTIFAGGVFHENTLMFEGPEGLEMIRRFRATKAFISSAGASDRFGVTCMNSYERASKVEAIRSSMRTILLVDSSKFGVVRSDHFAELSTFDEIITDSDIPSEYVERIGSLGITLRIAPPGP